MAPIPVIVSFPKTFASSNRFSIAAYSNTSVSTRVSNMSSIASSTSSSSSTSLTNISLVPFPSTPPQLFSNTTSSANHAPTAPHIAVLTLMVFLYICMLWILACNSALYLRRVPTVTISSEKHSSGSKFQSCAWKDMVRKNRKKEKVAAACAWKAMMEKYNKKEKAAAHQSCAWKDMVEKYRRKEKATEVNKKVAVDERTSLLDKSAGGEISEMRTLGRDMKEGMNKKMDLGL